MSASGDLPSIGAVTVGEKCPDLIYEEAPAFCKSSGAVPGRGYLVGQGVVDSDLERTGRVDSVQQHLAITVGAARDRAKELLSQLERQGHSQTGKSSAVYLALVTIHKRLVTVNPPPPPVTHFVPDLEQLVRGCEARLAPVRPLLEAALRVALGARDKT